MIVKEIAITEKNPGKFFSQNLKVTAIVRTSQDAFDFLYIFH